MYMHTKITYVYVCMYVCMHVIICMYVGLCMYKQDRSGFDVVEKNIEPRLLSKTKEKQS